MSGAPEFYLQTRQLGIGRGLTGARQSRSHRKGGLWPQMALPGVRIADFEHQPALCSVIMGTPGGGPAGTPAFDLWFLVNPPTNSFSSRQPRGTPLKRQALAGCRLACQQAAGGPSKPSTAGSPPQCLISAGEPSPTDTRSFSKTYPPARRLLAI